MIDQADIDTILEGMTIEELKEAVVAHMVTKAGAQSQGQGESQSKPVRFTNQDLVDLTAGIQFFKNWLNGGENDTVIAPNGKRIPCVARAAAIGRRKGMTPKAIQAQTRTEDSTEDNLRPNEVSDYVDGLDEAGRTDLLKHLVWKIQQYD